MYAFFLVLLLIELTYTHNSHDRRNWDVKIGKNYLDLISTREVGHSRIEAGDIFEFNLHLLEDNTHIMNTVFSYWSKVQLKLYQLLVSINFFFLSLKRFSIL